MKLKNYFFVALVIAFSSAMFGQRMVPNVETGPEYVGTVTPYYVPSLASRMENLIPAENSQEEVKDKRSIRNKVIIGKDNQLEDDYFVRNRHEMEQSVRVMPPSLVFDAYASGSQPTDPDIGVGPNHAFVVFNTGFRIFDKAGNPLTGQLNVNNIFSNGGCCDLTVSYDNAADRWVVSYLFFSGTIEVAVSDGPDPVTAGWNVYPVTGVNDYNKLSVWSDGYYVTANVGGANKVWALERADMLLGNTAGIQAFPLPGLVVGPGGFFSPQALNISDDTIPAPGGATIVFLQDDAFGGVATDHVKYWMIDVDWVTPANSTVSANTQIPVTPFIGVFDGGGFSNLTQPGGGVAIDALQQTIMNQAQFRKFGSHNSALFNFVVDTDATAGELAGVRWMEFRQTGDGMPWTLYQEGTYTAPDGRHAWHASLIMDANGNIGMGYTSMSGPTTPTTVRVSSYYTGRYAADPLGTMTVAEELIANGNANIPGLRYGDYSKIDIDPSDDATFWFIDEYMNSGRKGVVGVFQLAPNTAVDDIGVTSIDAPVDGPLTANEDITVSIRNFGSNDITNPPVQYTIDAGTPVVENYSGTIAAGATVSFTFATQADLSTPGTYAICAKTNLGGDTNTGNDESCKNVVSGAASYCTPMATAGCNLDGIKKFILNTIDADDGGNGCNTEPAGSPQGYADRTGLSTTLSNVAGSNVYTIQAQQNWSAASTPPFNPGDEGFAVWIDFDDSGTFEPSELLINDAFQTSEALEDFTLTIPVGAPLGSHRLRAKAIDITGSDILTNPCDDFSYGEVQDYTVIIDGIAGFEDPTIANAELIVESLENNQFKISLVSEFTERASIGIYNILGQVLAFNYIEKTGDRFVYELDMSYAPTGVYIIKMGDNYSNSYKSARIIVK